jgi:hypothetical protein
LHDLIPLPAFLYTVDRVSCEIFTCLNSLYADDNTSQSSGSGILKEVGEVEVVSKSSQLQVYREHVMLTHLGCSSTLTGYHIGP